MKTLCVLIGLALAFMGGWFCAIDACDTFFKEQVSFAQPNYPTAKYYRYGGSLDDQLARIRAEGQRELVAEWDRFQVKLWPWDTILREWRKL